MVKTREDDNSDMAGRRPNESRRHYSEAEDTEKQLEDDPVAKSLEDGNSGVVERRPDEARCNHSATENSESHGRKNYAE